MMSQHPKLGRAAVPTLIVAGLAVIDPGPLRAQATGSDDAAVIQELRRRLEDRDVLIDNLLQRVQDLERRLGSGAAAEQPVPPAATAPAVPEEEPAPPAPPPPAEEGAMAGDGGVPPVPGQFDVDPATIDRALEQALVRTGALLLPPGTVEVEPSLSYTRRESDALVVVPGGGGGAILADRTLREDDFQAAATLRVGLPYDSQLDLFLPYSYQNLSSTVAPVVGGPRAEGDTDISGFGDLVITFTKALLRERGWRPDLFARVRWDTDTGETDEGFALGSGTDEIGGSVTAVKRQDPLVFVGTLFYNAALEDDDFDPGDEIGLSLGTVLAASPDTSLRFFLDQSYTGEAEFAGDDIAGSDEVAASLFIGASSVLGRRLLLDVSAGIGLTDDAPDYSITVSLPIRFDLPFRF